MLPSGMLMVTVTFTPFRIENAQKATLPFTHLRPQSGRFE
jgi:hypothetical protein